MESRSSPASDLPSRSSSRRWPTPMRRSFSTRPRWGSCSGRLSLESEGSPFSGSLHHRRERADLTNKRWSACRVGYTHGTLVYKLSDRSLGIDGPPARWRTRPPATSVAHAPLPPSHSWKAAPRHPVGVAAVSRAEPVVVRRGLGAARGLCPDGPGPVGRTGRCRRRSRLRRSARAGRDARQRLGAPTRGSRLARAEGDSPAALPPRHRQRGGVVTGGGTAWRGAGPWVSARGDRGPILVSA